MFHVKPFLFCALALISSSAMAAPVVSVTIDFSWQHVDHDSAALVYQLYEVTCESGFVEQETGYSCTSAIEKTARGSVVSETTTSLQTSMEIGVPRYFAVTAQSSPSGEVLESGLSEISRAVVNAALLVEPFNLTPSIGQNCTIENSVSVTCDLEIN